MNRKFKRTYVYFVNAFNVTFNALLPWRIKVLISFLKYRTDPNPNIYSALQQTFVLDLLPSEMVSPDHREDGITSFFGDVLHSLFEMLGMQTWRRGLDVTDDAHLCKNITLMVTNLLLLCSICSHLTRKSGFLRSTNYYLQHWNLLAILSENVSYNYQETATHWIKFEMFK